MRSLLASFLLFASWALPADSLPAPQPVRVAIDVDAAGRVTHAQVVDSLPQATSARIVERVSGFEFTPASRAGKPVSSSTTLWLYFAFEALDADRVAIRISDAYTGTGYVGKQANPKYPEDAIRKRLNGDVSLRLEYDAEGRVTSTKVLEWSGLESFAKAAAAAVAQWHMLPERVDGEPLPGSAILPIAFRMEGGRMPEPSFASRSSGATVSASAKSQRLLVADSVVTLRTEVAGTLL